MSYTGIHLWFIEAIKQQKYPDSEIEKPALSCNLLDNYFNNVTSNHKCAGLQQRLKHLNIQPLQQ